MNKQSRLPVILCSLYCFIEIMLSTELIYLIQSEYLSYIKYLIALFASFLFVIDLLNLKLDIRALCLFLLFLIALGIIFFAKSLHILMLLVFLYLFRNYKFERILKYFYVTLWIAFVLTIFLSVTKIYPNIDYSRQGTVRYALGFGTPTLGQSILLFLLLTKFYLIKNNFSVLSIIVFTVLLFVMYYFTAGRTGFYLGILAIVCIIIYKIFGKKKAFKNIFDKTLIKILLSLLPLLFLFITLLMTKLYDDGNGFAIKLNNLLSTRLLLQSKAFAERHILLFGQEINWFNELGIYIGIDNSYLYLLFNYGIIIFVLSIAIYFVMINRALQIQDYCFLIIVIIILLNALVEPYLIDFKYNFFIFYPIVIKKNRENTFFYKSGYKKNKGWFK